MYLESSKLPMNCSFFPFSTTVVVIPFAYIYDFDFVWARTSMIFSGTSSSIILKELKSVVGSHKCINDNNHQIKMRVHFHWVNTEHWTELTEIECNVDNRIYSYMTKGKLQNKIISKHKIHQISGQRFNIPGTYEIRQLHYYRISQ